jgi:hypothetical protein
MVVRAAAQTGTEKKKFLIDFIVVMDALKTLKVSCA